VTTPERVLEELTRVAGVRGAVLVSREDGLVVAESAMRGVDGAAVAALCTSLTARLGRAVAAAGREPAVLVHLEGDRGGLMALPVQEELLLVAVLDRDANLGLLRLALRDAARQVG
jgi:predicted regulator of Ras-like GTPase activity (Roadblock/LC7/MglB family)